MVIGDAITPDSTIIDDMVMGMNKGDNGTHAKQNAHDQSNALNHPCLCSLYPLTPRLVHKRIRKQTATFRNTCIHLFSRRQS